LYCDRKIKFRKVYQCIKRGSKALSTVVADLARKSLDIFRPAR